MRMKGKVVLVTGGATGIGKGIALELHKGGAIVIIASRNGEAGRKTVEMLGTDAFYIPVDIRETESVNALMSQISKEHKRLDVLVNNAGIPRSRGIEEETEADWLNVINTNLNGYARCVRAALPLLKESRGSILNIASRVGVVGNRNSASYCTSKAGVIGFTKNLSLDLAKYGIRVNAMLPGWILTENLQRYDSAKLKMIVDAHPLGRMGTPEDCGKAACFLCSDDSSFITGITLDVDGGVTLGYGGIKLG